MVEVCAFGAVCGPESWLWGVTGEHCVAVEEKTKHRPFYRGCEQRIKSLGVYSHILFYFHPYIKIKETDSVL